MTTTILDDKREIFSLTFENDEYYSVIGNITKIVAYGEPAQYCNVPWFAIYEGDEIKTRVPAGQVSVVYKTVDENRPGQ